MKRKEIISLFKKIAFGGSILILVTVGIYILNFRNGDISSDPADWANLATYLSGIIGTITSILSLGVLAYITLIVADNSNEENKNLLFLKYKLEAFEKMMTQLEKFDDARSYLLYVGMHQMHIEYNGTKKEDIPRLKAEYQNSLHQFHIHIANLRELYSFFDIFRNRYSHLFKYDFYKDGYNIVRSDLTQFTGVMELYFKKQVGGFELDKGQLELANVELLSKKSVKLQKSVKEMVKALKSELN